jgi:hypothetical protein
MLILLCQLNLWRASHFLKLFILRQTLLNPFVDSLFFLMITTMINVIIAHFFEALMGESVALIFKSRASV